MKFDKEYIKMPIVVIIVVAVLIVTSIIVRATVVATVEHDKWTKLVK